MRVTISMFGRETPVELELDQAELLDEPAAANAPIRDCETVLSMGSPCFTCAPDSLPAVGRGGAGRRSAVIYHKFWRCK